MALRISSGACVGKACDHGWTKKIVQCDIHAVTVLVKEWIRLAFIDIY